MEEQAKCLKGAQAAFKTGGYEGISASFVNHCNKKQGKCFIEIYRFKDPSLETITLVDAYEGKEYGELQWNKEGGIWSPSFVA